MVELRKRAAPPPAAPPAKKKTATATAKARAGKKGAGAGNDTASETKSEPATSELAVGQKVGANGLAAAIETHDGRKVTLQSLLDEADKQVRAVAIFTYPKASTPGCKCEKNGGLKN